MLIHWLWFSQLDKITPRQKGLLLEHFSDPEEIYCAQERTLAAIDGLREETLAALENKDLSGAEAVADACRKQHINILTYRDAAYPSRLRNIADPPVVLYYSGVLPDFDSQPVIAVVGTRKATPYGISAAKNMAAQMACCGALVISGGATGIDTAAMEMAVATGNSTVAVLGGGVDIIYPAHNRELYGKVVRNGCLLSEYPPGTKPTRWSFPQRNRILSGLSHGVLVVEAPQKSGALITARDAIEQGRDVYAVPGNIDSEACEGSNALLRDGAIPALGGWDVLRNFEGRFSCVKQREVRLISQTQPAPEAPLPRAKEPVTDKKVIDKPANSPYSGILDFSEQEQKILACLTKEPISVDALLSRVDLPAPVVLRTLTMLSVKGAVIQHSGRNVSANLK